MGWKSEILDKLDQWLRGLLTEGIKGNLTGMFDSVNTKVGEIVGEVGKTPQEVRAIVQKRGKVRKKAKADRR